MRPKYNIGAFAIIVNSKDEVLLCHRTDYDMWNLPGGGIDNNESPWDGIKREVKEETGLEVKVERLISVYSKSYKNHLVFLFLCNQIGGKIEINNEARDIKYFNRKELPQNTIQKHIERINDYFNYESKTILKTEEKKSSMIENEDNNKKI